MSYIVVISAHLFWVGKQGRARLGEVLLRSVILSLSVRHNTGPPNNQTNKRARKKLKKKPFCDIFSRVIMSNKAAQYICKE